MWQQRKQLFTIPAFRLYTLSCLLAMIGNGLFYIAMTWMVLRFNDSVTSVVIVMFSFWLPTIFIGPFSGVIVDRVSHKDLFVWLCHVRGIFPIALGFLEMFHPSLVAIYWVSFFEGVLFSFFLPLVMSMIREIVTQDQLLIANSTVDIAYEVGNVLGIACAGFLIGWLTSEGTFIATGAMFIIAGFTAWMIRLPYPQVSVRRSLNILSILDDLFAGISYMIKRPTIRVIYTIQLLIMASYMTVPVLNAPFANNVLHTNVTQFGTIEAMLSLGIIGGALILPTLVARYGLIKISMILLCMLAIACALFSINRSIVVAAWLNLAIGIGFAIWPLVMTKAQYLTDLAYQGRVQASFNCVTGVIILLIYILVSYFSHYLVIAHLYWFEVALALLAVLLLYTYFHLLDEKS